jgi:hypothetical protein
MPYMSVQRVAAFAPETSWGDAASTPTEWFQIDGNPGDEPQVTYLENKALYGSPALVYDTITGVAHTKWSVKGNFFTDTGPYLMWLALGEDTVTGTAAPYTHTVQLANSPSSGSQPSSVTFWDIDNVAVSSPSGTAKLIAGCVLDSLSFSMSATGALTHTADFVGTMIAEAAAPTTQAFTDAVFLPAYLLTMTLNGATYDVIEEASIDIKRGSKPVSTLNGLPSPYVVWANGVDVTGKITLVVNGDDPVYWDALKRKHNAVSLTATDPVSGYSFTWNLPSVQWKSPKVESTKEWEEVTASFQANASTTDAVNGYTPIEFIFTSAHATALAS